MTMYSKHNPKLQLYWDSTSLGALKSCPRKYQYSILEGYSSGVNSPPLSFGIAFHTAVEIYLKATGDFDSRVREAVQAALACPLADGDKYRTRDSLIRALIGWTEANKNDPLVTIDNAVELSFQFGSGINNEHDEQYILCGHLDRVADYNGTVWVVDLKTTKSSLGDYYYNRFSPDNQMSLYVIAAQVVLKQKARGVIIDAVQLLMSGVKNHRAFVYRSAQQNAEWMQDLIYWLSQAEMFAKTGHYPMNDKSCFMCDYREACASNNPKYVLESKFPKRFWDPTIPR